MGGEGVTRTDRAASRRSFVKAAATATAGLALPLRVAPRTEGSSPDTGIRLGVASYSLRELSRADAIAAIRALRVRYVSVKSFHLPYELSPEALAAGRREFEDAGLQIVGGGVITLDQDDDDTMRTFFEYARRAGMPLMVIAPTPTTLPRIERFVREYGIKVAIHNHGPEDQYFPAPGDALPLIRDMDPRVGLCVDLGHAARAGVDVVAALAEAGDRLLDIHAKDLNDLRDRESQCVVGEGMMPFPAIVRQLVAMGYTGCVNLEYEIDAQDPLPGMQRSFAYMRGVLAGLGVPEA
jgi:sugar phosphate isomerase/epimerase